MFLKNILIICLVSFSFLFSGSKERIKELDKEIEYLEDVKRGFESKAAQFEDKAQDLQFKSNNLQESKRYWRMADVNKEAAKEVEKKIQEKKKERERLLK